MEALPNAILDHESARSPVNPAGNVALPIETRLLLQDLEKKVREALDEVDNHLATLNRLIAVGNLALVRDYELRWEAQHRLCLAAQALKHHELQMPLHTKVIEGFNECLERLIDCQNQQMRNLTEMKEAWTNDWTWKGER